MNPGTLLFRADASVAIGTGHVMRCLALAQAWQDAGGTAIFAVAELPTAIEQRLAAEGFSIARTPMPAGGLDNADATVRLARECGADWVVVDGDRFDEGFLQRVHAGGTRVLLIDDFAERECFPADLILNPNLNAPGDHYRKSVSSVPLLLGASYVMLRREFTAWTGVRAFAGTSGKILVTLGGSDPENLTPRIAESLAQLNSHDVTVIAGPGNPCRSELEKMDAPNVHVVVDPIDMCEVMKQADMAIIVGGGTLWELLYMECAVLSYARNAVQSSVVRNLEAKRVIFNMGATTDFEGASLVTAVEKLRRSTELRQKMAASGRRMIDGQGARRVLQALREVGVRS